ncbi:peptidase domain-containing ABC transporter [Pseudoalteromonas sp. MMG012]|uniref:peptidase domain-containing ABC transporter n=1 Tax=Pseudoalteromonas sp. MMG012 TaxID=2822686 RepID=UPI001B3A5923|nr:peptidase domain-containing ABC transporter [Pseudoalteromonas sp. MMG012]MBQ4851223.1 peptidase domain-containing ABC transporter [Pseudoalteromonas sp. MMG012]
MRSNKKIKIVFQDESSECSLACLTMIANFYGANTSLSSIRNRFPVSNEGVTLKTFVGFCKDVNLSANPLKSSIEGLSYFTRPIVLHWDMQHFVVLHKIENGMATIYDPARGIRKLPLSIVSNHFTGIIVDITPDSNFAPINDTSTFGLKNLIGALSKIEIKVSVAQIILLSVLMEALVLMQPFLFKQYFDKHLNVASEQFLMAVGLTLMLIAVSLTITTFIRDYAVIHLSTIINYKVSTSVFEKLMALPLAFFEKRQIGHIIERHRIINDIQQFFSSTVPLAIIDGLITLLTLLLVFHISFYLGLISVVSVCLYFLIRKFTQTNIMQRELELLYASGEASGHIIETLKTIHTTKINAIETQRFNRWSNFYGDQIKASKNFRMSDAALRSAKNFVQALNASIFFLVCALLYSKGDFSIGLILAVIFYNSHFMFRSTQLIDRFIELIILNTKAKRVEDMFSFPPEINENTILEPIEKLKGQITIKGLSYYLENRETPLLSHIDFKIHPGEFIAITGENGVGKTTLMRMLLGITLPTSGSIYFDQYKLSQSTLKGVRSHIGCVSQDEQLFVGTIAENIALFDPEIDFDRVVEAAKLTGVFNKITSLSMGFSTHIGDMGSPFSEGEKQKISIAKALYKNPNILMLDEGTANLDAESEKTILRSISNMPCTKVVIAHRPAFLEFADRVITIKNGTIKILPKKNLINQAS